MNRVRTPLLAVAMTALLAGALTAAPALATKAGSDTSTGRGTVFMVNPVQSSGDQGLTDAKDSDAAVPASAYAQVALRNLDGSGYLRGRWVTVRSATGAAAYSTTNTFDYLRHDDRFEQVMGYFWVNQAQSTCSHSGSARRCARSTRTRRTCGSTSTVSTTATRPTSRTSSGSARAGSTTPRTPR